MYAHPVRCWPFCRLLKTHAKDIVHKWWLGLTFFLVMCVHVFNTSVILFLCLFLNQTLLDFSVEGMIPL